jgi:RNA polymerase sigma factor (sigma-70 family)
MYHDSPATQLLECAAHGMESAWREIVKRFSPLIFAICRRYGIGGVDIQDVAGEVWVKLLANVNEIREPNALPGWLRTTVRNECLGLLRARSRQIPTDTDLDGEAHQPEVDAKLIGEERHHAARQALAHLSQRDRQLMSMLFSDPPTPYKEISSTLGIPVGAIGPTRARCLTRARRTPAVAALAP